jgi:hypothetical protein
LNYLAGDINSKLNCQWQDQILFHPCLRILSLTSASSKPGLNFKTTITSQKHCRSGALRRDDLSGLIAANEAAPTGLASSRHCEPNQQRGNLFRLSLIVKLIFRICDSFGRLLRFARALKDDEDILRKCPWGAMTVY